MGVPHRNRLVRKGQLHSIFKHGCVLGRGKFMYWNKVVLGYSQDVEEETVIESPGSTEYKLGNREWPRHSCRPRESHGMLSRAGRRTKTFKDVRHR